MLPPGMSRQHFCDHVFRTLDLDGNGNLDFKEYVLAMDLLQADTPEEKLKWAFRICDVDKSGKIDRKEMAKAMKSIYAMVATEDIATNHTTDELATAHAAKLFTAIDVDNDGELDENEFIEGSQKDKVLMEKLQKMIDQCMEK